MSYSVTDTAGNFKFTVVRRGDGKPDLNVGNEEDAYLFAFAGEMMEVLEDAPIIRLGESLEDFKKRYVYWYGKRHDVLQKARGKA